MSIVLVGAALLGILHNSKRRAGLRSHAKLLAEHTENTAIIADEVAQCEQLLQNIFPPQVALSKLGHARRISRIQPISS